jgi:peptidoglycan/xylan/chitin deacetylase (PgdA/CDA1 family)
MLIALIILDVQVDIYFGWYLFLLLIYISICAIGSFILSAEIFLPVKTKGDNSGKKIAITFDDGPIIGQTDRILSILEKHKVRAAFFCIGSRIQNNEKLFMQIDKAEHLVGNHSFYHKNTFGFLHKKRVCEELSATDSIIEKLLTKRPRFFRPPFGVTNPMIAAAVVDGNYQTIGWSNRSFDTVIKDSNKLFRRVTAAIKSGDVILFHDYSDSTIEMLPAFIQYVQEKGFEIVRLDELLNEKAYR